MDGAEEDEETETKISVLHMCPANSMTDDLFDKHGWTPAERKAWADLMVWQESSLVCSWSILDGLGWINS
jgi:hypothetical protein